MNGGTEDLRTIPLGIFEFRENRRRARHTVLKRLNKVLPFFVVSVGFGEYSLQQMTTKVHD
jgi:hypothetical protein